MSEYLKCDAPGCAHLEDVAEITEDMIGKPCPACGANLLTPEDFAWHVSQLRPAVKAMHAAGLLIPAAIGDEGAIRFGHHNGEITVTAKIEPPTPSPKAEERQ